MKLLNVVGARPNYMKIAPLMAAYRPYPAIEPLLVHTGQHYDERMSDLFFHQLGLPEPDLNLGVGGGTHAVNTAETMKAFEQVCLDWRPDAVLVVGDVNSTIACGLVAVKLGIRLFHVEAGLRSFDRAMPEEINRILTDAISELFFCTEPAAVENLRREGQPEERIHLVGNVMIDTLLHHRERAEASPILHELGLEPGTYGVLTLHRPGNVDDLAILSGILDAVEAIQRERPLVFPIHPRTRASLAVAGLVPRLAALPGLRVIEPLGYLDFLKLQASARLLLTDSGGIQEESTILGVPCVVLRETTERPITLEYGLNYLAGNRAEGILQAYRRALGDCRRAAAPPLWDGHAAERIAAIIGGKA